MILLECESTNKNGEQKVEAELPMGCAHIRKSVEATG